MGEEEVKQTKEEEKKSYIQELKEIKKGLDESNAETARLVAEQKELIAEDIVSGRTTASKPVEEPKEESPEDYSKRLIEGKVEDAP